GDPHLPGQPDAVRGAGPDADPPRRSQLAGCAGRGPRRPVRCRSRAGCVEDASCPDSVVPVRRAGISGPARLSDPARLSAPARVPRADRVPGTRCISDAAGVSAGDLRAARIRAAPARVPRGSAGRTRTVEPAGPTDAAAAGGRRARPPGRSVDGARRRRMTPSPVIEVFMPDGDEARRWAGDGLSRQEYEAAKPTWFDQLASDIWEWILGLFRPEGAGTAAPIAA